MPSRIRTESMIDRLGKKPLSEGFDLWDKDYCLGALRLFQCKLDAQTAGTPPFEVAAALDAVGEIMIQLEETEEAADHFKQAVDKYSMIQKKPLADLMECKATHMTDGVDAALPQLETKIAENGDGAGSAVGRMLLYKAQLLALKGDDDGALTAVDEAVKLGSDRVHVAHSFKGSLLSKKGDEAGAEAAYRAAMEARDCYVPAYLELKTLLQGKKDHPGAIGMIDKAMEFHPQASLQKEKAFEISEGGDDEGAIAMLDKALEAPMADESEGGCKDSAGAQATLLKAKAAIYADSGKSDLALAEMQKCLELTPDDEEAQEMAAAMKAS